MELFDNQTVVLDEGAVVYGGFRAFGAKNITITGTGILDGSREIRTSDTQLIPALLIWPGQTDKDSLFPDNDQLRTYLDEHQVLNGCIRLYNCKTCVIEHITFRDSSSFTVTPAACDNILIDDVKMIGMQPCQFIGMDELNHMENVVIENLTRNGIRLTDPESANLSWNEFVRDITLK